VRDIDERTAWLILSSVDGIGEETFGRLLALFGSAREALAAASDGRVAAESARWRQKEGRPLVTAPALIKLAEAARAGRSRLALVDELGLWSLTPLDAAYPSRLRDLDPAPAAIYGLGDEKLLRAPRIVAVVGTRRPTGGGRVLASQVAGRLVDCSAVVVSGLAVGIDGAAHSAVLERGGSTIGVIGAGHGNPGPRAHEGLRRDVVARGGAVISEHHPSVGATRGTYPRRNRIIAALGDATIVVEAPARSGALITARHALELDRPVMVAPGRVGDWSVRGSLRLLHETPARPLVGLDEMTADLGYFAAPSAVSGDPAPVDRRAPAFAILGTTERVVAERLCRGAAGLDTLVAETGLAPSVVSGAVTLLLMRGWVQAVGPAYLPAGPLLG
jgi:DNA processing protein